MAASSQVNESNMQVATIDANAENINILHDLQANGNNKEENHLNSAQENQR